MNGLAPREGMRMAELAERSGVARETIHFYLREGLLPRPRKGGKTVAYYDEEHLERLRTIRRLREEKYLPLAVIKRLLESPVAAAESDIDVLAEVLHLGAPLGEARSGKRLREPSGEARKVAQELGLLGGAGTFEGEVDPADLRVLAVVEEALGLAPAARALTLADLEVCAADMTALVTREAELFFDAVLRSGDVGGSIAALREGRGAVARFITAYRDRMLRRIVDDLLVAIEQGPEVAARAAAVALSPERERELGAAELRERLRGGAARGEREAAVTLIWHLFGCGAAEELAALPPEWVALGGEREAVLALWGRLASPGGAGGGGAGLRALERAAAAAPGFALGEILVGEAALTRALRRRDAGTSLLEQAVPALHRIVSADPMADPEPLARALGLFHQGRVELSLPPVLGRARRGALAIERALEICAREADLDPVVRARLEVNARMALDKHRASQSSRHDAPPCGGGS
jgi:DNA-binding transcriptional MerR regulator